MAGGAKTRSGDFQIAVAGTPRCGVRELAVRPSKKARTAQRVSKEGKVRQDLPDSYETRSSL
jgi:hypothetical protein